MPSKNLWLWIGGAIVIVLIVVAVVNMKPKDESAMNEPESVSQLPSGDKTPAPSETVTPTEEPATPTPAKPKPATVKPAANPGNAYQTALDTYDYRIQFVNCHGTTKASIGTLSVKKGVKFMLDNRDKKIRTIAFAGQSHRIGAQSFAIASIPKAGTYNVTCDGGGAAKINVED